MGERKLRRDDRLAVLIDGDNESANLIEPLLEEVAKYGTANVKRVYGDWTGNQLNGWKSKLHKYAIQPIQQYNYVPGKNATDSALIIDAMDLLYTGNFDGFCLVSSDSDFTKLACRLREAGLFVYGFGRKKTPTSFQKACDKFTYTEIFVAEDIQAGFGTRQIDRESPQAKCEPSGEQEPVNKELTDLLRRAYEATAGEDGLAELGALGSQINKISSSFDPRNYGYKKLRLLVRDIGLFEVQEIPGKQNPLAKVVYIKLKG
ncbi:hypothetical protein LEP3755_11550 [Leptolyngbya sp. NIES-3755]|nr:hypothetical protein LEP3755_11550 [Leptolyngbya sp. NIES-3755]